MWVSSDLLRTEKGGGIQGAWEGEEGLPKAIELFLPTLLYLILVRENPSVPL